MEKSNYENIGNAELFFLIKLFLNNLEGINPDITDNHTTLALEDACSKIGLDFEFPIDVNYVISTINLNEDYDFESKSPSGLIKRPKASLYSFDYDEHRREYVRRTYRNTITSYSDDIVTETIRALEESGDFEYYDGNEIDTDYYDGETTDTELDISSITKIKQ